MLNHKDSDENNFQKYSELTNQIRTETNTKQRWQTDHKASIQSGNINSKVLTTGKKVKYIEEPEQLKWNEYKKANKQ